MRKVPVFSCKAFGQVPQGGAMCDPPPRRSDVLGIRRHLPEACFPQSVKTEVYLAGLASHCFALLLHSCWKGKVEFGFQNCINA